MAIQPDAGLSWAAALLDLYRATQNRSGFDDAVREFGFFFDRIAPVWSAIGDGGEPQVAEIGIADPESVASGAIWDSPAELTAQAMEDLREAMSSRPPPWHVDWTQLTHIDPDAMSLLAGLFTSLCAEEVGLRFSGSERLVAALRAMTPSGDRSVEGDWWVVRLTALRAMHLQDEFELAALDFCVTFEVAPPAWEEPRCEYEAVQIAIRSAQGGAPSQRRSVSGALPGTAALEAGAAIQLELRGQLIGDATQALAGMERKDRGGERITVSCAGLVRVDFSAAGSILNWVATRQSEGCLVQFRDVHRLVAAFFNVIGINEHSRVVPRPI
jgi:anti-anti-sigma regulatory factor